MSPEELLESVSANWEIEVDCDLRVPAIISLIKAAHLSLFDVLGYRYALSLSGIFAGKDILGRFFLENHFKSRDEIRKAAFSYFREYQHMVRPFVNPNLGLVGSISDLTFLCCMGSGDQIWGLIVFVRTVDKVHGILLPEFGNADMAATYLDFLKNGNDTIHVTTATYDREHGRWLINPNRQRVTWPKTGILYPQEGKGKPPPRG